jgi:hypothetical protein
MLHHQDYNLREYVLEGLGQDVNVWFPFLDLGQSSACSGRNFFLRRLRNHLFVSLHSSGSAFNCSNTINSFNSLKDKQLEKWKALL